MSSSEAAILIFLTIISTNCLPKPDLPQTECFAEFDTMTLDQCSILSILYYLIIYRMYYFANCLMHSIKEYTEVI